MGYGPRAAVAAGTVAVLAFPTNLIEEAQAARAVGKSLKTSEPVVSASSPNPVLYDEGNQTADNYPPPQKSITSVGHQFLDQFLVDLREGHIQPKTDYTDCSVTAVEEVNTCELDQRIIDFVDYHAQMTTDADGNASVSINRDYFEVLATAFGDVMGKPFSLYTSDGIIANSPVSSITAIQYGGSSTGLQMQTYFNNADPDNPKFLIARAGENIRLESPDGLNREFSSAVQQSPQSLHIQLAAMLQAGLTSTTQTWTSTSTLE